MTSLIVDNHQKRLPPIKFTLRTGLLIFFEEDQNLGQESWRLLLLERLGLDSSGAKIYDRDIS